MGVDGIMLVPDLSRFVEDNVVVSVPSIVDEFAEDLDLSQPLETVPPPAHPEPIFIMWWVT